MPASEELQHFLKRNVSYYSKNGRYDKVWKHLSLDRFLQLQIETLGTYEASLSDLQRGLDVFHARAGQTPEDDARLAWIALKKGATTYLSAEDSKACLDSLEKTSLDDIATVDTALRRIASLSPGTLIKVSFLLFLQGARMSGTDRGVQKTYLPRRLLALLRQQFTSGKQYANWRDVFGSPTFLSFWITQLDGILTPEEWFSAIDYVIPQQQGRAELLCTLTVNLAKRGASKPAEALFDKTMSAIDHQDFDPLSTDDPIIFRSTTI